MILTKRDAVATDKYKNGHHKDIQGRPIFIGDLLLHTEYKKIFVAELFTDKSVGFTSQSLRYNHELRIRNVVLGKYYKTFYRPQYLIKLMNADFSPVEFTKERLAWRSFLENPKTDDEINV